MKILDSALNLIKEIESYGYKAYIVGGAVRDYLLSIDLNDIDIATSMPLELLKDKYEIDNIGIDYLSIKLKYDNYVFDVTRFRIDTSYNDHRHPIVKFTDTLEEDIKRRDFTINALAMDSNKKIIDYVNGIDDLTNKIIKIIGDPNTRFNEDALRILRALRFSSTLGFIIDNNTLNSMYELKDLINTISAERITEELNKMICGKYFKKLMENNLVREIFAIIIPEIKPTFDFDQRSKYHKNKLFDHLLSVIDNVEDNYILKLAALFHDIGKTISYQEANVNGDIIYHFWGHQQKSVEIANEILKRLHYSNKDIDMICWLIKYHDYKFSNDLKCVKRFMKNVPANNQDLLMEYLIKLKIADSLDHINVDYFDVNVVLDNYHKMINNNECYNLKTLNINGNDLIELGIDKMSINNILNDILDKVIEDELPNKREVLIDFIKNKYIGD